MAAPAGEGGSRRPDAAHQARPRGSLTSPLGRAYVPPAMELETTSPPNEKGRHRGRPYRR
jgi:hypothetical protein